MALSEYQRFSRGIGILEKYAPDSKITTGIAQPCVNVQLSGIDTITRFDLADLGLLHFFGWKYKRTTPTQNGPEVIMTFDLNYELSKTMGAIEGR